jgi:hypothetical protein
MANCKGCGAPIMWIVTRDGKKMPLDAKPRIFYHIDSEGIPRQMKGHEPHWGTCPKAKQFKKKG